MNTPPLENALAGWWKGLRCARVAGMPRENLPEAVVMAPSTPVRRAALLLGLFVAVHAGYYAAGLRYDRGTLIEVMHYLDPALLRERLLESLWYLHIQPPLMNLFVGLVLKVTPASAELFQAVFLALGFGLYVSVDALQRRLGVSPRIALATSTVFMASPSFLLWEHILLYTMPCAALLAMATYALLRGLETARPRALHAFFWLLATLCGVRTMFHLGYLLLVWGGVGAALRGRRRAVLLAGLLPVLLVVAMYAKNAAVFGQFTVSTFAPKNLWIMTVGNMNGAEKVRWVEEGKLSRLSLINRWESMEAYPAEYQAVPPGFADVPAAAAVHKSTGAVNYNHYGLIAVAQVYGADARYALLHAPWSYAVAVLQSWYRYFIPSHALPVSPQNQATMPWAIAAYNTLVYGRVPMAWVASFKIVQQGGHPPHVFLIIGLPLVWLWGVWRALGRGGVPLSRAQRGVLLFMTFNILMVMGLGCALDFLETARYRFMTDGLSVVLLGLLLHDAANAWRARRAAGA